MKEMDGILIGSKEEVKNTVRKVIVMRRGMEARLYVCLIS